MYFVFPELPNRLEPEALKRAIIFGKRLCLFLGWAGVAFFLVRVFDAFFFGMLFSRRSRVAAPLLLRQIISFVLYALIFGFLISFVFEANVTAALAGTTILAAVIGLALQDTLGNLFSGIALHIENTFDVGDVVRSGELIGVVEGTNWRATRLRTFNNNIVILPNSIISRERLEVFPRNNLNARVISVDIGYQVPPAVVIPILEQAAANAHGVSAEIPCIARVGNFRDSGISYEVKYWTRTYHLRDSIDADLRRAIWYALKRNKISIPYPVRVFQRSTVTEVSSGIDQEGIRARLQDVEILAPLSEVERNTIAEQANLHHYSRGETIIRHGQAGDSMFVLHDGTVRVRLPGQAAGADIAQLGPGSIFGEMALLTGEARTADVVAITDVTALEIEKQSLQPILEANPDLAAALSANIVSRKDATASAAQGDSDDHKSILQRIKTYFGLKEGDSSRRS